MTSGRQLVQRLVRISALVSIMAGAGAHVEAADARHVMFILDASNSMWAQLDGRPKIDIAKEVLTRQFARLADETSAGLIAYGHRFDRRLNDCGDMELVGGYGRYSSSQVREMLDYVTPKGQTPIAATLEGSIDWIGVDVNNQPIAAPTVVLITDGAESCDGDPCAAATKLAEAGISTKVHVVGFDLNDEQRALVGCIAENGNGRYFDARDAAGLENALVQVAQADIPAPGRESVFVDDFNGTDLGDQWMISNPAPDSYIVENGELLAVSSKVGGLGVADTSNIFVLDAALPEGDWDAAITFKAELKTLRDQFQFGLWEDAGNGLFATLWTETGISNCSFAALTSIKRAAGEPVRFDIPVLGSSRLGCGAYPAEELIEAVAHLAEKPATIVMHKRGRSYHFTADIGGRDGSGQPVVYQSEPLTSLRLPGKLAFAISKHSDAQGELAAMIDRIEVFSYSQWE